MTQDSKDLNNPSTHIPVYVLYSIFIVDTIMTLCGILGNLTVTISILCHRNRQKITNLFLLNIAIANLLYLGLSYPIWAIHIIMGYEATHIGNLYAVLPPFCDILSAVVMFSLTKLAIIRHNMIYRSSTNEPNVNPTMNIISIWCACVVLMLVPRLLNNIGAISSAFSFILSVVISALWYMTPLSVITGTYISTKMFLNNQFASEWFKGSGHTALVKNQVMRCQKSHRLLGPVVITSALLFFPLFMYPLLNLLVKSYLIPYQIVYSLVTSTCIALSSFLYPVLLCKLSRDFKINAYGLCYTVKEKLGRTRSYNISNPDIYQRQRLLSHSSSSNASSSFIYHPHDNNKRSFCSEESYELAEIGRIFQKLKIFHRLKETVL